jgi:hypothetical protein
MQTQTVEVYINVAQDAESKLYDCEPKFTGEIVLRALTADGVVLHEARMTMANLDVSTSDYARVLVLAAALERLHTKLHGNQAGYALRVVQSSNNVEGWLARGWKRNTALVKELAGAVDNLLKLFPRREFVKLPRAELEADGNGSLLARRGDLANLSQFSYDGLPDIVAAIQQGATELIALEQNPPRVDAPPPAAVEPAVIEATETAPQDEEETSSAESTSSTFSQTKLM